MTGPEALMVMRVISAGLVTFEQIMGHAARKVDMTPEELERHLAGNTKLLTDAVDRIKRDIELKNSLAEHRGMQDSYMYGDLTDEPQNNR